MPQDQSPERRAYAPADAEPSAAQVFDPVAFARRLEVARAQRAEALARRDGLGAASDDAEAAPRASAPVAGSAFAPDDRPARAWEMASADEAATSSPRRPSAANEPLVAPLRRPAPRRAAGASRALAAGVLLLGVVVAGSPPLRQGAAGAAGALLPGLVGAQLAEPAPPAPAPERIPSPAVALRPDAAAPVIVAVAPTEGPVAPASPAARRPALLDARAPADFAPPADPRQPAATPAAPRPSDAEPDVASAERPTPPPAGAPEAADPTADGIPRPTVEPITATATPVPVATAGTSVAVHAPPNVSDAGLADAIAALGAAGLGQPRGVRVGITIERTQVRYFHAADAAAAQRLAAALGPNAAQVRDFTHFSPPPAPGRLEVWLSGAAAERVAAPGTPAPMRQLQSLRQPPATAAPAAPTPAAPARKLVVGRATVAHGRPVSPVLERLYARPEPDAAAPESAAPAPRSSAPPAPAGIESGLY